MRILKFRLNVASVFWHFGAFRVRLETAPVYATLHETVLLTLACECNTFINYMTL